VVGAEVISRKPRANAMTIRAGQTVIEFPRDQIRTRTLREAGDGPGEVVFFTGIWIERMPEDKDTLPKARSSRHRNGRGGRR
jgi:hypothetical protein